MPNSTLFCLLTCLFISAGEPFPSRAVAERMASSNAGAGSVAMWAEITEPVPANSKLPSLAKDADWCKDADDDACWRGFLVDLNGDGRQDLVAKFFFGGNDPDMADDRIFVFLASGSGFRRVLASKTDPNSTGEVFVFGPKECKNLGQYEGDRRAPRRLWIWDCKSGKYASKPRTEIPDPKATAKYDRQMKAAIMQTCVECCTMLFVADQPHACMGSPVLRDCRVKGIISENELMESVSAASAAKVEAKCPKAKRMRICHAACEKIVSDAPKP